MCDSKWNWIADRTLNTFKENPDRPPLPNAVFVELLEGVIGIIDEERSRRSAFELSHKRLREAKYPILVHQQAWRDMFQTSIDYLRDVGTSTQIEAAKLELQAFDELFAVLKDTY